MPDVKARKEIAERRAIAAFVSMASMALVAACARETHDLDDGGESGDAGGTAAIDASMAAPDADAQVADAAAACAAPDATACAPACTIEWRFLGARPNEERGHSLVFDAANDRFVMFGGRSNATWVMPMSGPQANAWSRLEVPGELPPPRWDHAAVYDPRRGEMIVFGGYVDLASLSSTTTDANLWALSLSSPPRWRRVEACGPRPSARARASMIYDAANDRFIVAGGEMRRSTAPRADATHLVDTWALSLGDGAAWTELHPAHPFPVTSGGAAVYDSIEQRMLAYRTSTTAEASVWALSLSEAPDWTALSIGAGPAPSADALGAAYASADGGHLHLVTAGAEVWSLALDSMAWAHIADRLDDPYYFQTRAAADPAGDRILVRNPDSTYLISMAGDRTWRRIEAPPDPNSSFDSFLGPPMVFDATENRLFALQDVRQQVWALSLARPDLGWTPTLATSTRSVVYADSLSSMVFDAPERRIIFIGGINVGPRDPAVLTLGPRSTWSFPKTEGPAPLWIDHPAALLDASRDRILVYGGYPPRNEVLSLALTDPMRWTVLTSSHASPPTRSTPGAVIDTRRDRLIVVGGYSSERSVELLDVWALSLTSTPTWTELTTIGMPTNLHDPLAVYWPEGDAILIPWSSSDACGARSDLWMLPLDSLRWRRVFGHGASPTVSGPVNRGGLIYEALASSTDHGPLVFMPGHFGLPWLADLSTLDCPR
jgi:Kelch motif protein